MDHALRRIRPGHDRGLRRRRRAASAWGLGHFGLAPELGFELAHWSACRRVYIALEVRIGGAVVGFTGGGP